MKVEITEEGDGHVLAFVDEGEWASQGKAPNNSFTCRFNVKI